MATTNTKIVLAALEAIRAQDADRALHYFEPQFVEHNPYIAAGVEGLRHYIKNSTPEHLNLQVVRALEDNQDVVVQLKARGSGQDAFEMYRLKNGLIVEHWAFFSPGGPPNKSGHTQLDGPTEPKHLEDTERNKAFVRDYYESFHLSGEHNQNDRFFAGDLMIRHEPGVHDGVSEFLRDVAVLMQHRTIDEIKLMVGQGDLVFLVAKGTHEGAPCAYIDLYRVENLKLVEHWGFPQPIPPQSERKNTNEFL